jgi:ABC-type branched-subunit amino acid transport system ATPase component
LRDLVDAMPEGVMTDMIASGKSFSASTATKMVIARCIAEKPQLLILNDIMHDLQKGDRLKIIELLISHKNPWTLLLISNDPLVMASCDRVLLMKDGEIIADGKYTDLLSNEHFRICVQESN